MRLIIGTYPHGQNEMPDEGVWSVDFDQHRGALENPLQLTTVASPSFVAVNAQASTVFAVSEVQNGQLHEYEYTNNELVKTASVPTNGVEPCHVITVGGLAIATNYTTGSVCAYRTPLSNETPGQFFQHSGTGPNLERQEGPHAHFAGQVPGTQYVWVTDLGSDRINLYVVSSASDGGPKLESLGTAVQFPAGAGPRHIAFSAHSRAYVVGELDNNIYTVAIDEASGRGEIVATTPITTTALSPEDLASHIELDGSEQHLFVAVRGVDLICVLDVNEAGELAHAASFPTGGTWPRHFRVLNAGGPEQSHLRYLIVANQQSHAVNVTEYDTTTRAATLRSSAVIPAPAAIAPLI